ncbi:MAG TPA: hypothetical protein VLG49_01280, partial [Rhabdochlamydiaceae bacterium]|nr:hypothetical protein [Rhabdochlamydiaceae bacterium]
MIKKFFNKSRSYLGLACIAAIFVILTSSANFRTGPFSFHPSDRSVFDLEKNLIVTSKIYTAK